MGDDNEVPASTPQAQLESAAATKASAATAASDAVAENQTPLPTEEKGESAASPSNSAATPEAADPAEEPDNGGAGDTTSDKEAKTTEQSDQEESKKKPQSSSKKVAFVYDPTKIPIRFIFANRDGLSVVVDCQPSDTVGEVKGALLSVWPDDLPECAGGDRLRLICMGKGVLMPDTRTLEDCQVPVFKTHPTPVNVSVRPELSVGTDCVKHSGSSSPNRRGGRNSNSNTNTVSQGCGCVIL